MHYSKVSIKQRLSLYRDLTVLICADFILTSFISNTHTARSLIFETWVLKYSANNFLLQIRTWVVAEWRSTKHQKYLKFQTQNTHFLPSFIYIDVWPFAADWFSAFPLNVKICTNLQNYVYLRIIRANVDNKRIFCS